MCLFFRKKKADNQINSMTLVRNEGADDIAVPKVFKMKIKVAGVTFEGRQKLLREIYKSKPSRYDIEFKGVEFEGELAIEIHMNGYMIGYVPKDRVEQFYKHLEWKTEIKKAYVDYDPDHKNYYAQVTVYFHEPVKK